MEPITGLELWRLVNAAAREAEHARHDAHESLIRYGLQRPSELVAHDMQKALGLLMAAASAGPEADFAVVRQSLIAAKQAYRAIRVDLMIDVVTVRLVLLKQYLVATSQAQSEPPMSSDVLTRARALFSTGVQSLSQAVKAHRAGNSESAFWMLRTAFPAVEAGIAELARAAPASDVLGRMLTRLEKLHRTVELGGQRTDVQFWWQIAAGVMLTILGTVAGYFLGKL